MPESHTFFVLDVIFFVVRATLQAGATGAVKTVKMSAKLSALRPDGAQPAEMVLPLKVPPGG